MEKKKGKEKEPGKEGGAFGKRVKDKKPKKRNSLAPLPPS